MRIKQLYKTQKINVRVVYIKREFKANVAGFTKRKRGFINGILTYTLQHFLIRRFFAANPDLPYLFLQYEDLCEDLEEPIGRMRKFL